MNRLKVVKQIMNQINWQKKQLYKSHYNNKR